MTRSWAGGASGGCKAVAASAHACWRRPAVPRCAAGERCTSGPRDGRHRADRRAGVARRRSRLIARAQHECRRSVRGPVPHDRRAGDSATRNSHSRIRPALDTSSRREPRPDSRSRTRRLGRDSPRLSRELGHRFSQDVALHLQLPILTTQALQLRPLIRGQRLGALTAPALS